MGATVLYFFQNKVRKSHYGNDLDHQRASHYSQKNQRCTGFTARLQTKFSINDDGDVLLQKAATGAKNGKRGVAAAKQKKDRFEQVRGKADVHWRTQDLMNLMRGEH